MDVCIPEPLGGLAHQSQPSDVYANLHLYKTVKLADCNLQAGWNDLVWTVLDCIFILLYCGNLAYHN